MSDACTDKGLNDNDAVTALILAETRMLYKNDRLTKLVQQELKDKFVGVHESLRKRTANNNIKEAIDDLLQLV